MSGPVKDRAEAILRYHTRNLGWSDTAYSFFVGEEREGDGVDCGFILEARGFGWDQFATGGDEVDEHQWVSVCWLGGEGQQPGPATYAALAELRARMEDKNLGRAVKPHSAFRRKACPGPDLTKWAGKNDGTEPIREDEEMDPKLAEMIEATYHNTGGPRRRDTQTLGEIGYNDDQVALRALRDIAAAGAIEATNPEAQKLYTSAHERVVRRLEGRG